MKYEEIRPNRYIRDIGERHMKLIIAGLILVATIGCAKISYINKDGEKFSYMRFGTMKLSEFEANIKRTGDKKISIGSSEGTSGDLAETLKNLSEVAKAVVVP